MADRLSNSTSPFLADHADDPIDWWGWGSDALEEARARDVPVMIVIGYSSCQWCRTMSQESFTVDDTARLINDTMVSVLVDRNQNPDVDSLYLAAAQALGQSAGWPLIVFTDCDGRPFYASTYLPPATRGGRLGFADVISGIADTWQNNRQRLTDIAASAGEVLIEHAATSGTGDPATEDDCVRVRAAGFNRLLQWEDRVNGGFGGAPKFLRPSILLALARRVENTGSESLSSALRRAFNAIVTGAIHDQVGGGFFHYTADNAWMVPQCEKRLSDSALMMRALAAYASVGSDFMARHALRATLGFVLTEMQLPGCGFATSLDSHTDGVEGKSYLLNRPQLKRILGEDMGRKAARLFDIPDHPRSPKFHTGSVPVLATDPPSADQLDAIRKVLITARRAEQGPRRDENLVMEYNGQAIVGMVEAAHVLGGRTALQAVLAAAAAVEVAGLSLIDPDNRRHKREPGGAAATLADLAWWVLALLKVNEHTGNHWQLAVELLADIEHDYADPLHPGRYFDSREPVAGTGLKTHRCFDSVTPASAAVLTEALVVAHATALAVDDGDLAATFAERARALFLANAPLISADATRAGSWLAVGELIDSGPTYAVVRASRDRDLRHTRALLDSTALIFPEGTGGIVITDACLRDAEAVAGEPVVQLRRPRIMGTGY
ncbi:thioredoxin domain-containing protein [Corynebacterium mendelii]|uniref:Thioredoxin domain-containing protein n=1 Tax=Corynebacterium mendelii TaxID=2765362 RepID=A0A939E109_9CORY|nr:DUF255 domain-containing protein [Corynebacterium mendelii]MBN9643502.1 thioredoxin domain-containing protein [Corynebacterium mendelii]